MIIFRIIYTLLLIVPIAMLCYFLLDKCVDYILNDLISKKVTTRTADRGGQRR